MNKYCPNCKMNFSESFEECPCCEGALIIQDLNVSETIEPDILEMTDEELLVKYKDYLESMRQQGCEITDKEFVNGLREGRKDTYRNTNTTLFEEQWHPTTNPQYVPKCPICQSTNLSKISTIKKATKIGLFGIFGAGDVGKTYKCNNCGSKF